MNDWEEVEEALGQGCDCSVDGSHTFPETVAAYPTFELKPCSGVLALRRLRARYDNTPDPMSDDRRP